MVAHYGVVHQIYNNAGVAGGAVPVIDCDYDTYERIIAINLWGVIHGTKEFLPYLIESGDGHVVNISSLNGIMAQASMSAYCTTKFAVRGFTESLRAEMLSAGHPVQVARCTRVASRPRSPQPRSRGRENRSGDHRTTTATCRGLQREAAKMSPQRAARIILDGVQANRRRVLVGKDAKGVDCWYGCAALLRQAGDEVGKRTFGGS